MVTIYNFKNIFGFNLLFYKYDLEFILDWSVKMEKSEIEHYLRDIWVREFEKEEKLVIDDFDSNDIADGTRTSERSHYGKGPRRGRMCITAGLDLR